MRRPGAIVVFDGECGLCNGFVAWLIQHDGDGAFALAGSRGDTGRAALEAAGLPPSIAASSLVVWDGADARLRSEAVIAIARALPWPWRGATAARAVPQRLRDAVYDAVARRRPRIVAEDPACGVPPAELTSLWRSRLATPADVERLAVSGSV